MLVMRGQVIAIEPTKAGKYERLVIGTGRRVNDLIMARVGAIPAKVGQSVEVPVRAAVETNADGRPTKFITFWHDVPREAADAE